jgi:hypothetical protein
MLCPGDTFGIMVPDVPRSVSRYMAEIGRRGGERRTVAQERAAQKNIAKAKGRPRTENPSPAALAMREYRARKRAGNVQKRLRTEPPQ